MTIDETIGAVGGSLTELPIKGAQQLGDTRFWDIEYRYGGGQTDRWFGDPGVKYRGVFSSLQAARPASKIWWMILNNVTIGEHDGNRRPETDAPHHHGTGHQDPGRGPKPDPVDEYYTTYVDPLLDWILEQTDLTPADVFVSPMPVFSQDSLCEVRLTQAPAQCAAWTDRVIAERGCSRGPVLTVLTPDLLGTSTVEHGAPETFVCHQSDFGMIVHGRQLIEAPFGA